MLIHDALATARASGEPLAQFCGVAFGAPERDARLTRLASFGPATAAVGALPLVAGRYGTGASDRLTLQFVYTHLAALTQPDFDPIAFENTWAAFWQELLTETWTHIGVANLKNFNADFNRVELGDGVTVRLRSFHELRHGLSWGDWEQDQLAEDWRHGDASSYVLYVEHQEPKSAANLITTNAFETSVKADRALLTLRLLKEGDVRMGRLFFARRATFNVGLGGLLSSVPVAPDFGGLRYCLDADETPQARELYALLSRFEITRAPLWPNVGVALRAFTSSYQRRWNEDVVVNAITAAEALVGDGGGELTFKLAFRTAALLARGDEERQALFQDMKTYYAARSSVVHGGVLKRKQQQLVAKPEPLRAVVRRLLVALLHLVESPDVPSHRQFIEHLDGMLLHDRQRLQLQKAAGLPSGAQSARAAHRPGAPRPGRPAC